MIELAKCCATCAYTRFLPNNNSAICKYYRDNNDCSLRVSKVFICEHWVDSRTATKKPWTRPSQNQTYWRNLLSNLNKKILKGLV